MFRLSRIRGKVAYATKAEHDFQRPTTSTRASTPTASRGSSATRSAPPRSGSPSGSPGTSSATSAATGADRRRRRRARLPHPVREPAAPARVGDRLRAARARARPAELAEELTGAWTASPSCTAASRWYRRSARPRRPRDGGRREPGGRQREATGIRPERFARLVTLASVLIQAGRAASGSTSARSASGSRCRRRSCARTSPCSTS